MKFLIVGLGNVGDEYTHTRHNIGFDVVNAFVARHGGKFHIDRLAYVAEVKWKGRIFVCICPTTYMNLSGKAVKYWMDKENIAIENILVVLDEIAIPIDRLRLKPGGSPGGHNGLKSIHEVIGSGGYARLRFGIGNNFPKGFQSDYVLSKWTKDEEPIVKKKIELAVEAIGSFATSGVSFAMNQVNNHRVEL